MNSQALGPASVLTLALLGGCASSPPSATPASASAPAGERAGEDGTWRGVSRVNAQQARDATVYAIGLVGTPYRFGGNTPDTGFDCSGLIGHVYQTTAAVQAPRTVSRLHGWGQSVPAVEARSGDLVIFAERGVVTHAGIYVGEGRFVHAPSTGGTVRLDSLRSKYWAAQPTAFRRP